MDEYLQDYCDALQATLSCTKDAVACWPAMRDKVER
jgi:hypothetical protein